jgi:hypothetical protein
MNSFFVKKFSLYLTLMAAPVFLIAQNTPEKDSLNPKLLDSVTVRSYLLNISPQALPPLQNVYIYSGKNTISLKPASRESFLPIMFGIGP